MNVSGKVIFIAGAAGLIGKSLVEALILKKAKVIAMDCCLSALRKLDFPSDKLLLLPGNINDLNAIQPAITRALENFGKIDGAVNTAYPKNAQYGKDFLQVSYQSFCENLNSHLGGYFLFMQQWVKYAKTIKHNFSLVNLSSVYGSVAPRFDLYKDTTMTMPVEYAAIKAGLQQLIKYVCAYTKGLPFRVNCVSPGGILNDQPLSFIKAYEQYCHSKGLLIPEDIVQVIIFLLSDEAQYIQAQNILVDDGFHL